LWEFPGGEATEEAPSSPKQMATQLRRVLRRTTGLRAPVKPGDFAGQVEHAFTHFRITRHVAVVRLGMRDWKSGIRDWGLGIGDGGVVKKNTYAALRWVPPAELSRLALARSDHKVLSLALPFLKMLP
jgi:adenine-specific DNA glycosylase